MNIPPDLDPSIVVAGLLYLLIFRLGVILLGGICIYLGYRLFTQNLSKRKGENDQATELEAKFGNNELTLRSVAPGIFFVAFGSLVTVSILAGSPPELKVGVEEDATGNRKATLDMRGNGELPATWQDVKDELWERHDTVRQAAEQALRIAAGPRQRAEALNNLASVVFAEGDAVKATDLQSQALAELPESEQLKRRLAAYRTAAAE